MRIGHGYDVHALKPGRKLILGGVEITHNMGLDGHSDADVLTHAVMDAILGALAKGDIGQLFPDTDDDYLGADSLELLVEVAKLMSENNYRIGNLDATIIAQKPKLMPYISEMRKNLALCLNAEKNQISIKATTEEKLGFTGRCEGIAAHCVVLLEKIH